MKRNAFVPLTTPLYGSSICPKTFQMPQFDTSRNSCHVHSPLPSFITVTFNNEPSPVYVQLTWSLVVKSDQDVTENAKRRIRMKKTKIKNASFIYNEHLSVNWASFWFITLTILWIIINFGPRDSYAEKRWSNRIVQRIRSMDMNTLH